MSWYRTLFAAGLVVAGLCSGAYAADYPTRPIKMIVPFPPGGTTDIMARLITTRMSERLGQPFIIDNRPGAGGSIGTAALAKSPPDGYTIVFSYLGPMIFNRVLNPTLDYDPVKDFAPISLVALVASYLVVPAATPVTSVPELIAYEKANRGKLFYASVGVGSGSHIFSELFNIMTGTKFMHVPYKGGAPANIGTIAGEVTLFLSTVVEAQPHIKSGKLRALAYGGAARLPISPEIPTIGEFVPGYAAESWFGLLAPAGTPRAIVELLHRTTVAVLEQPDVHTRFLAMGVVPKSSATPDEFSALIKEDDARWPKILKDAGIKAE